jgi:uncharacterized membrane protein
VFSRFGGGYIVCAQYCFGGSLGCFVVPPRHSHHDVVVLCANMGFSDSFLCAGRSWCLIFLEVGPTMVSVFLFTAGFFGFRRCLFTAVSSEVVASYEEGCGC